MEYYVSTEKAIANMLICNEKNSIRPEDLRRMRDFVFKKLAGNCMFKLSQDDIENVLCFNGRYFTRNSDGSISLNMSKQKTKELFMLPVEVVEKIQEYCDQNMSKVS